MTHREFLGWLREVESRYLVLEWRIGSVQVWPMIRQMVYGSNFHAKTEGYSLGIGFGGYARVAAQAGVRWAAATAKDAARNTKPGVRADAVFLAYSIGRQPLIQGWCYNTLLAPYVELLGERGLRSGVWETSPFGDYNVPRHTPSALVQPWMIWWRLRSQLARPGLPRSLDGYARFCAEVAAAGFAFPYADAMRLERDVFFVRRLAAHFAAWLRQARPRLGFVADASLRDMAFCLACREFGIPSVEIQHGVQGAMHPTYAGWTAVPPEGFALKPRVFWCWDASSAAVINAWAPVAGGAHEAIVGGDPWREMWLASGNDLARRTVAEVGERVHAAGGNRHILVTLSSNREVLPDSVREAVRSAPPGWRWWFRMHPVNQAERRRDTLATLRALGQEIAAMDFATEAPLHALLYHMDAHVTVGLSTVVLEALDLGVPSVGCMSEARDFYAAEVARGAVRVALSREEMTAALDTFFQRGRKRPVTVRPDPGAAMDRVLALAAAPAGSGAA